MKQNLSKVISEIEHYIGDSNLTELEVIDKLKAHYFNKKLKENLKLYKKGKKKVRAITKDLQISPRKFYAILEKKKVNYTKYNKSKAESESELE